MTLVGWAQIACCRRIERLGRAARGEHRPRLRSTADGAGARPAAVPAPQDWKAYARSAIVFSFICMLALYGLLRTQGLYPFNPQHFGAGTWASGWTCGVRWCS